MIRPRFNLWLEKDGQVALSAWRVRLLEAVARTGSISAAAAELNVPYRRAWERLHEMEVNLGEKLVATEVGGARGGGAELTARGADVVSRFHRFADGLEQEIATRYERAFASCGF